MYILYITIDNKYGYVYLLSIILRTSELHTPPLYGRLAVVPDACPLTACVQT